MLYSKSIYSQRAALCSACLWWHLCLAIAICLSLSFAALGQSLPSEKAALSASMNAPDKKREKGLENYFDPKQGSSSADLVSLALSSNGELAAARLNIERARARVQQAGLRPNPSLDVERQNGVFNSPGESATMVGVSVPLEIGGKRGKRIDLAKAELEAAEADLADRERRLANTVRTTLAEALASLRELEITQELIVIDTQAVQVIERRVKEGDAAPLEQNLLRVELERIRSRRALVAGRLQAALLRLQTLVGMSVTQPLRLSEALASASLPNPPGSLEATLEIALRTRPDLRLAILGEEAAKAGLRLAQAQAVPDVTLSARYGITQSSFDSTPIGALNDRDRIFTVGVSIPLPLFNRNQGAKAESLASITQSQRQREFVEQVVRAEVSSAWARYEAVKDAIKTFEDGVLTLSANNVRAVRGAYEIGEFRVSELLNEQRRLIDSQREYTEALAERYRALSDLKAAIGTPEKQ